MNRILEITIPCHSLCINKKFKMYQVVNFVVRRKIIEFNNVRKISLDDVIRGNTASLQGQVIIVRIDKSNWAEDGFDLCPIRR